MGRTRGAVVGVALALGMLAHADGRLLDPAVHTLYRCMAPFHGRTMPPPPERGKAAGGDEIVRETARFAAGRLF